MPTSNVLLLPYDCLGLRGLTEQLTADSLDYLQLSVPYFSTLDVRCLTLCLSALRVGRTCVRPTLSPLIRRASTVSYWNESMSLALITVIS